MNHITDQTLALALEGKLDENARDALFSHLAQCDACDQLYRLAASLQADQPRQVVLPQRQTAPSRWGRTARWNRVAAACLVLLVVPGSFYLGQKSQVEPLRLEVKQGSQEAKPEFYAILPLERLSLGQATGLQGVALAQALFVAVAAQVPELTRYADLPPTLEGASLGQAQFVEVIKQAGSSNLVIRLLK